MKNIWKALPRPILILAPMANVTDSAFRQTVIRYGKPSLFFTEFVSADGLCSAGKDKLLPDFYFSESERPIVAQIFGANLETMRQAAKLVAQLGFDGVDINMGCPDRAVEKQGAGAALMKNPLLARDLILAAREGAPELPISIKTRLGYKNVDFEKWLPKILEARPAAVTIHGRTREEMSKVPARWEEIARARELIKKNDPTIAVIGNGDVATLSDAKQKSETYGLDGAMIGRAALGNPWFFSEQSQAPALKEKLEALLFHAELFDRLFRGKKNFLNMRKHAAAYVAGSIGAKELRMRLLGASTLEELRRVIVEALNISI